MSDGARSAGSADPTDVARELHLALICAARAQTGEPARLLFTEASELLDALFLVDRRDSEAVSAFEQATRRRIAELTRWLPQ